MKRACIALMMLGISLPARPAEPLTLVRAIEEALVTNPAIRGSVANVAAAGARAGAARAAGRPAVSATTFLSTGTMGSILAGPSEVMPQSLYTVPSASHANLDISAMAPLSTGGRISARTRMADAATRAAMNDLQVTRADVELGVRLAWRGWQLAQAQREITTDALKASDERLRVAEERYKVGSAARLEVLRARTDRAEARQAATNSARDVETARLDIQAAIGTESALPSLATEPLEYTHPTTSEAADIATALESAPEILAAVARAEEGRQDVFAARAAYRPQVSAMAMADTGTTRGEGGMSGYTVGIVVGLPLVDGGLRRAEVTESQARRERAAGDLDAARVEVRHDVAVAWARLRAAEENLTSSEAGVTEAEEGYRVMNQRYEAGKALLLEVLDALSARTRARTLRVEALYEAATATDRLDRAVGRMAPGHAPSHQEPPESR